VFADFSLDLFVTPWYCD